jgi:mono/diheme cytochrome c family protein
MGGVRGRSLWAAGSRWIVALALTAVVLAACGSHGSSSSAKSTSSSSTSNSEDADLTAADFPNINAMTPVGGHFVTNVRGHLDEALAVAHSPNGGRYPVGTIIQLVPQEAMVKLHAGFSPATDDWEFFSLDVSASGTKILTRGGAEVLNRFGGSCSDCHGAAQPQFDFVCGQDHGCAPLPIGPDIITALQKADPRPH